MCVCVCMCAGGLGKIPSARWQTHAFQPAFSTGPAPVAAAFMLVYPTHNTDESVALYGYYFILFYFAPSDEDGVEGARKEMIACVLPQSVPT